MDKQSATFREMTWDDLKSIAVDADLSKPWRDRDQFEGWDSEKMPAKTIEEAKLELIKRVNNPLTSDNDPDAYEELT